MLFSSLPCATPILTAPGCHGSAPPVHGRGPCDGAPARAACSPWEDQAEEPTMKRMQTIALLTAIALTVTACGSTRTERTLTGVFSDNHLGRLATIVLAGGKDRREGVARPEV